MRKLLMRLLFFNGPESFTPDDRYYLGEAPFKNYAWMLRHDAESYDDRYTPEEHRAITAAVDQLRARNSPR